MVAGPRKTQCWASEQNGIEQPALGVVRGRDQIRVGSEMREASFFVSPPDSPASGLLPSCREYLTGFHKRKVERKKAAIEEIKQRLKKEQKKLREERHQEYLKMLAEREEALEEADELDRLVTAKTESVQYDHPNHTVTVTTISDLDLSGARLLGLPLPEPGVGDGSKEETSSMEKPTRALPRKSKDPLLSQRISSLTASLHAHSRKKVKRKRPRRAQDSTKKPPSATRTSKTQRRRLTGKARHSGE
ncbi:nucleolar protein 12 isoform X1 [Sciurus carolinensis]|uniref:nucleolar protein 12 isoform X1 n=1 Tax=Sciurus carolinensis TaxID=30640 RepID=UPI001FB269AF|nr:nucleolar protein 12 isoform X1 [Sciurus carolinensis]